MMEAIATRIMALAEDRAEAAETWCACVRSYCGAKFKSHKEDLYTLSGARTAGSPRRPSWLVEPH